MGERVVRFDHNKKDVLVLITGRTTHRQLRRKRGKESPLEIEICGGRGNVWRPIQRVAESQLSLERAYAKRYEGHQGTRTSRANGEFIRIIGGGLKKFLLIA